MRALAVLGRRWFSQAIHRTLSISCPPLYQIPCNFDFLFTYTSNCSPEKKILEPGEEQEAPKSLSLRIEKLARGESVGLAFQSWMREGFPIHRGDIFHAINRLRKLKLNKRALEVSLSFSSSKYIRGLFNCLSELIR